MLDEDKAELYSVTTGNMNKAVKRNAARFPGRSVHRPPHQYHNAFGEIP